MLTNIKLKELYEIDDHLWLEETIKLLKNHQFDQIDLENLIEELESLSRRDKAKVASLLEKIIIHLLLLHYWPEEYDRNKNHWQAEIFAFQNQLNRALTKNLANYLEDELEKIYQGAVKIASQKIGIDYHLFPSQCPYTLTQLLEDNMF